jgi:hypothetical protein
MDIGNWPGQEDEYHVGEIEGLGATYRCKVCSYETHNRAKMLKHLAKNTHLLHETFSL